jgi:hypothetical protein
MLLQWHKNCKQVPVYGGTSVLGSVNDKIQKVRG